MSVIICLCCFETVVLAVPLPCPTFARWFGLALDLFAVEFALGFMAFLFPGGRRIFFRRGGGGVDISAGSASELLDQFFGVVNRQIFPRTKFVPLPGSEGEQPHMHRHGLDKFVPWRYHAARILCKWMRCVVRCIFCPLERRG